MGLDFELRLAGQYLLSIFPIFAKMSYLKDFQVTKQTVSFSSTNKRGKQSGLIRDRPMKSDFMSDFEKNLLSSPRSCSGTTGSSEECHRGGSCSHCSLLSPDHT